MFKKFLVFLFTINVISNVTYAEKIEVFKFNDEELQTLKVRKIKKLTDYSIGSNENGNYLKAEAEGQASGLWKEIKIDLNKQIFHLIKNLQKVSGFLGSKDKPTPISDTEIQRILGQVSESAKNQKSGISFEIGEKVKVCDGPFASFSGLIEEIDEEKSRLKVSVSIFGRPTPVDLEYNQVEKT